MLTIIKILFIFLLIGLVIYISFYGEYKREQFNASFDSSYIEPKNNPYSSDIVFRPYEYDTHKTGLNIKPMYSDGTYMSDTDEVNPDPTKILTHISDQQWGPSLLTNNYDTDLRHAQHATSHIDKKLETIHDKISDLRDMRDDNLEFTQKHINPNNIHNILNVNTNKLIGDEDISNFNINYDSTYYNTDINEDNPSYTTNNISGSCPYTTDNYYDKYDKISSMPLLESLEIIDNMDMSDQTYYHKKNNRTSIDIDKDYDYKNTSYQIMIKDNSVCPIDEDERKICEDNLKYENIHDVVNRHILNTKKSIYSDFSNTHQFLDA